MTTVFNSLDNLKEYIKTHDEQSKLLELLNYVVAKNLEPEYFNFLLNKLDNKLSNETLFNYITEYINLENLKMINFIISKLNYNYHDDENLIMITAIKKGNKEIIKFFTNQIDIYKDNNIFLSYSLNNLSIFKFLIKIGLRPNESNNVYYKLIVFGKLEFIKYLLDKIKLPLNTEKNLYLYIEKAIINNHIKTVKYLLLKDIKFNPKNPNDLLIKCIQNNTGTNCSISNIKYLMKNNNIDIHYNDDEIIKLSKNNNKIYNYLIVNNLLKNKE